MVPFVSGVRFTWFTVTLVDAYEKDRPSPTRSRNLIVVALVTSGAVKDGNEVLAPTRLTSGPDVLVQLKLKGSSSGSSLPEPSRFTTVRSSTVWFRPASARGA